MDSICKVDHIHNSARAMRIYPAGWNNTISKTAQHDDIQRRGKCSLQNKQHLESVRMSVHQSNPWCQKYGWFIPHSDLQEWILRKQIEEGESNGYTIYYDYTQFIIDSYFVSASAEVTSTQQFKEHNILCSLTYSRLIYIREYFIGINWVPRSIPQIQELGENPLWLIHLRKQTLIMSRLQNEKLHVFEVLYNVCGVIRINDKWR